MPQKSTKSTKIRSVYFCAFCAFLWLTDLADQALYDCHEFFNLHRLRDVRIVASGKRAYPVLRARVSRECDGRNVLALAFLLAHLLDQVVTIGIRHSDVANH